MWRPERRDSAMKIIIFFYFFIFISWRLITLQYCSDFCHHIFEEHIRRNETESETKDVIRENFSYQNKDLEF